MRRLHLDGGGYSHPGRRRVNADVWAATCRRAVLSDGAGMWGAWAAQEAVQAAMHSAPGCLESAVRSAHAAVGAVDAAALATLVAVEVLEPAGGRTHGDGGQRLEVANVGDSGCLLAAGDGRCEWLTELHNGAADLAREGVIAAHQIATHPFRHCLTRSLGGRAAEPDVASITVGPGDRLVLVTDGVPHGALDAAVLDRLARTASPSAAAESIVLTAFEAGATDNITAVVVEVVGAGVRSVGDAG